ncbi:MAG: hypothetical protein WCY49_03340 [Anaerovoracaceae bacterium]
MAERGWSNKKQIIAGIAITPCVALCAALWLRSARVEPLPAEPVKTAVGDEIEARSEETPHIFIFADASTAKPISNTWRGFSTTMFYKYKKLVRHPESEQILVENIHEPLITQ